MFENLEIWVYSFNSGTWKRVCNLPVHLFDGHLGSRLSAYLDGSIYIPVNNTIVQFRLCDDDDEQVQTISLLDENVKSSLIVIDESLCIMKTNGSVQEFYKFINGNWVQFLVLEEENMLGWTLLGKSADNRYLFNAGEHFLLYGESDGATENLGVRVIDGFDFYILILETTFWPRRPRYERERVQRTNLSWICCFCLIVFLLFPWFCVWSMMSHWWRCTVFFFSGS
ncbi:hypothetical protein SLE2022_185650 [Rubroshorea leprosula]